MRAKTRVTRTRTTRSTTLMMARTERRTRPSMRTRQKTMRDTTGNIAGHCDKRKNVIEDDPGNEDEAMTNIR